MLEQSGLPPDFDESLYKTISETVSNRPLQGHLREHFAGGWKGLAYRFRACAEYDLTFSASIRDYGEAPLQPERFKQDMSLFGFFVSGLSSIECLAFAIHAICATLRPEAFSMVTEEDLRKVSLGSTSMRLQNMFHEEPVALAMSDIVTSREYGEWKDTRNILVHRAAPGRIIHASVGGKNPDPVGELKVPGRFALDQNTTRKRRRWLAEKIGRLMHAQQKFIADHL